MNETAILIITVLGIGFMSQLTRKKISKNGLEHLKKLEGERLKVYKDSAGYLTVGVGHKVLPEDNLKYGDIITTQKSMQFLRNDLAWAERAVNVHVKVPLNQAQYDALVSFVFNVGVNNFSESTLLKKLNQYDYNGALAEFPKWKYATDQTTQEKYVDEILVERRKHEQDLFNA